LKQVGLAAENAHDARRALPPLGGSIAPNGIVAKGPYAGRMGTLLFFLLPFLEEGALYNLDASFTNYGAAGNIQNKPIATYACPSETSGLDTGNADGVFIDAYGTWGLSNYGGNHRVFGLPGVPAPQTWEGIARMPKSFPDGVSKTIFFAEKFGLCGGYMNGGSPYPFQGNGSLHSYPPAFGQFAWCALFGYADLLTNNTNNWDQFFQTAPYPWQTQCDPTRAQGPHAGAIMVGLGDGSVRPLADSINQLVWHALLTPGGGEVIDMTDL
jgi:hypothetical protein